MRKIIKYFLLSIPIVVVSGVLLLRHLTRFDLGSHKEIFNSISYSDLLQNGKTQIERLPVANEVISFEYTLDSGSTYPYCGAGLIPKSPEKFFRLRPYDLMELQIKATKGKRILLQLSVLDKDIIGPETESPHRLLTYDLDLKDAQSNYTIQLSQFKTPTWWYSQNNIPVEKLSDPDLNKVTSINIQNCQLIGLHKTDLITVNKLVFKQEVWKHWIYYTVGLLVYYGILFLLFLKTQKPKMAPLSKISFHEKLALQNHADKDLQKLITYLGSHYQNAEMSIPMVQKETGVSESKISALLKSEFGTTFKQYLTELRLNEAKRLLKDTDLQIAEIAYAVGFGNVSHFNRVFKTETQLSPSGFRASQSQ